MLELGAVDKPGIYILNNQGPIGDSNTSNRLQRAAFSYCCQTEAVGSLSLDMDVAMDYHVTIVDSDWHVGHTA